MDKFGGRDGSTRERRRLARTEKQVEAINRFVRPEPPEAACPAHEVSALGTGIVEGDDFGHPLRHDSSQARRLLRANISQLRCMKT